MSAATIVFMDLVGFSNKSTSEQKRLVESLTNETTREVRGLLKPPFQMPEVIALPTGDGMALAFLHSSPCSWSRDTIYNLINTLLTWATDNSNDRSEVALRCGIHVGPVEIITDINGNPNVCGDTINYAQRIMDAANPQQVLMSEEAFRHYMGAELAEKEYCEAPFAEDSPASIKGPIQVFAKHGIQIPVYMMVCGTKNPSWNSDEPVSKHLLLMSLTELPKEILGPFAERLRNAKSVAFVQLGGERLLPVLREGKLKLSDELNRLWVFMPHPDIYDNYEMGSLYISTEELRESVSGWQEYLSELKTQHRSAQIKMGLYSVPPFWGGSFLDWDRPKGTIHISPYLWNREARSCPGYDLQWLGENPSDIYESYMNSLNWLDNQVENFLD